MDILYLNVLFCHVFCLRKNERRKCVPRHTFAVKIIQDTIPMSVKMDAIWNNDPYKPDLSFKIKCLSEWTRLDQNLPTDMFT